MFYSFKYLQDTQYPSLSNQHLICIASFTNKKVREVVADKAKTIYWYSSPFIILNYKLSSL